MGLGARHITRPEDSRVSSIPPSLLARATKVVE